MKLGNNSIRVQVQAASVPAQRCLEMVELLGLEQLLPTLYAGGWEKETEVVGGVRKADPPTRDLPKPRGLLQTPCYPNP